MVGQRSADVSQTASPSATPAYSAPSSPCDARTTPLQPLQSSMKTPRFRLLCVFLAKQSVRNMTAVSIDRPAADSITGRNHSHPGGKPDRIPLHMMLDAKDPFNRDKQQRIIEDQRWNARLLVWPAIVPITAAGTAKIKPTIGLGYTDVKQCTARLASIGSLS